MFYVTQGLVERGSPTLPPVEGAALSCDVNWQCGSVQVADGSFRSAYPLLPSFVAIPFYFAGSSFAQFFDARFHEFLTRVAVTGVSALASAVSAAVVAMLAVELGASTRGAILISLLFGTTTIAWPYARYFWSEPIATACLASALLFAIRTRRSCSRWLWFAAALALGLAVATRLALAAAIPAIGFYLVVNYTRDRHATAVRWLAFGSAFLGPALLIAWYNVVRFGSIFQIGYGTLPEASLTPGYVDPAKFAENLVAAVGGLFFSPGKSLFLYAPPVVAGVLAIPALWRRAPRETALFGGIFVSFLALFAAYGRWQGEAAWGPRYLVPLVPVALLPLAAWFPADGESSKVGRFRFLSVTAGLGLAVQVLSLASNYDTYILQTGGPTGPGAERRWFDPAASPLLASAAQLRERMEAYLKLPEAGEYAFTGGVFAQDGDEPFPRWTTGRAEVEFVPSKTNDGRLHMSMVQPDGGLRHDLPELRLELDGQPIVLDTSHITQDPPGHFSIDTPLAGIEPGPHHLIIKSPTFQPFELQGFRDYRDLGVQVTDLRFDFGAESLRRVDYPVVPPLPVSDHEPWSRAAFGWFYDPRVPHLVDLWPWYAAMSGLPGWLAATAAIPGIACLWFGWRLTRMFRSLGPAHARRGGT